MSRRRDNEVYIYRRKCKIKLLVDFYSSNDNHETTGQCPNNMDYLSASDFIAKNVYMMYLNEFNLESYP